MFNISYNGIITVNRGDSFKMPLFIDFGNALEPIRYTLTDNDIIYFGVMEPNQPFETALIRKKYTSKDLNQNGDVVVEFTPKDTECVLPGKYYYQVKLQKFQPDGTYTVNTVIDKTQFFIME